MSQGEVRFRRKSAVLALVFFAGAIYWSLTPDHATNVNSRKHPSSLQNAEPLDGDFVPSIASGYERSGVDPAPYTVSNFRERESKNVFETVEQIGQPNIILINLDDADIDLLDDWVLNSFFPNIAQHLRDGGTRFANLHVVAPLCGPSRASLFRAQYPHNTMVDRNRLGFQIFYDNGFTDDEIGMWMREAGYYTALVGKYCHEEYPQAAGNRDFVPPGWDYFHASLGNKYFETRQNVNGERITTGVEDYRTETEISSLLSVLEAEQQEPLFLYFAPFAPHGTSDARGMVAPKYEAAFATEQVPRTPDFNEADISDKTPQYSQLPQLSPFQIDDVDERYRDRIRSMKSVDDGVGQIFETLERRGLMASTYVILTSDNGFQLGHHRDLNKKDVFDRVTRVQALVVGPGVPAGAKSNQLLAHIDIPATILDLGGAEVPRYVDGVPFTEALRGDFDRNFHPDGVLITNREGKVVNGVELDLDYDALRLQDSVYVEWANGDREFYDLSVDPFQLDNSYDRLDQSEITKLSGRLAELRVCQGSGCERGDYINLYETEIRADEADGVLRSSQILGTANTSAGNEIRHVEVVVRAVDSGMYANGRELQSNYFANLVPINGLKWVFDLADLPAGEYWISARAVGHSGDADATAASLFVFKSA